MKKIIKLLSIFSLTATSSLTVISCSEEKEIPKLTLGEEKTDIINAINLKNTSNKDLNVTIDDITLTKAPTFDGKSISYDITIKQDAKSFLNNNFTYRIPEVIGNFDISNNKITNKIFKTKYLTGNYLNYINFTGDILTGTKNDFTLILDADDLSVFYIWTMQDFDGGANGWLKHFKYFNSNITLTNLEWKSIFKQTKIITNISIPTDYAGCIHVIKNSKSNYFKVAYTNLTIKDQRNIPLAKDSFSLPLTAFQSSEDIEDGSVITTDNKFITLNKDILSELKDIYNAKLDNQDYGDKNWNVNSISKILENNIFSNTNLDYNTIANCIYNNWNVNIVNNFLSKNYSRDFRDDNSILVTVPINFLTLQYDKDNNYVKNNLNI